MLRPSGDRAGHGRDGAAADAAGGVRELRQRLPGDVGAGRGTYAVKCFTRAVPDRLRRYRAIGDTVASLPGDWRVDVEYVPNGVLVQETGTRSSSCAGSRARR
ncbi:hypothetical protein ACU686_22465 [Yinghuangia aomiensis]